MTASFLKRRERAIHVRRQGGDLAGAERYGWLSLAAVWVGLGPQAALHLDPTEPLDFVGSLVIPPEQDTTPIVTTVACTSLTATDPRDAFGLWLADLAADAATHAVVTTSGAGLAGTAVVGALHEILGKR